MRGPLRLTPVRGPPTIAAPLPRVPAELRLKLVPLLPLAALLAACATPAPQPPAPDPLAITVPEPPPAPPAPAAITASPVADTAFPPEVAASLESLPPPAEDLWDRIRKGFALPELDDPLVAKWEAWYSSRPDYVARMVDRSRRYLYYVIVENPEGAVGKDLNGIFDEASGADLE